MGNNMMEDIIGDIINEDMITWEYTQPSVFNGDMIEDVIGDILGVVFSWGQSLRWTSLTLWDGTYTTYTWLVVSTPLKNISQLVYGKIKAMFQTNQILYPMKAHESPRSPDRYS